MIEEILAGNVGRDEEEEEGEEEEMACGGGGGPGLEGKKGLWLVEAGYLG